MITAKEARKLVKSASDNELKKFREKIRREIERCANREMTVAEICFNMRDELQLARANKVKEELISKGFICEVYKNTNAAYFHESGKLRASW